jgi:starch phosphorylase
VQQLRSSGYQPRRYYEANPYLHEVLDQLVSGEFSAGDHELFRPIVDSLLNKDEYLLLADYQSYVDCQEKVAEAFRDQEGWTRMSILNTARMGKFSSDRSIREYCEKIWGIKPHTVPAEGAKAGA